jgi:serine/threonine protein kinase
MASLIGKSLGRYHILEQLGEGGMATVYKAHDTRLERDVAVKIIRVDQFTPASLERVLQRFEREAKALAKLSHPNIVGVIDYGDHEGVPYLVMEYLPGGSLKQRLGKPMPWQEAARLLLPIARGLGYAHQRRVVHRDVKPSNILIGDSGEPMLADFGIARILESGDAHTLTGTGLSVGTPEYMAPEQWTGEAGSQADIYSLGVGFYEMVTGRKPYTADTPAAILLKQATEPLPRPAQFVPGIPAAVEKVLCKALERKPEDRYADMAAFGAALEGLLAGAALPEVRPSKGKAPKKEPYVPQQLRSEDSMETVEQVAAQDELVDHVQPEPSLSFSSSRPASIRKRSKVLDQKPSSKRWIPVIVLLGLLGIGLALGGWQLKMGQQGQRPMIGQVTDTLTLKRTSTSTYTFTLTTIPSRASTPTSFLSPTFPLKLTPTTTVKPMFIAGRNINCRSGPSTIYSIVAIITSGASLPIMGRSSIEWGSWWQVDSEKGICWLLEELGTSSSDTSMVEIVNAPPTPVPILLTILNGTIYYVGSVSIYGSENNQGTFSIWPRLPPGDSTTIFLYNYPNEVNLSADFWTADGHYIGNASYGKINVSSSTSFKVTYP